MEMRMPTVDGNLERRTDLFRCCGWGALSGSLWLPSGSPFDHPPTLPHRYRGRWRGK